VNIDRALIAAIVDDGLLTETPQGQEVRLYLAGLLETVRTETPRPDDGGANGKLGRVRALLERIDDEDNEFGTASAGWRWWQETCEELASEVASLDNHLAGGGALPSPWRLTEQLADSGEGHGVEFGRDGKGEVQAG
jgi:hypothetical protein